MPASAPRRLVMAAVLLLIAASVSAQPDPAYWRLDDIHDQITAWEQAHPDLIHRTSLGPSGLGEEILLVRISDNAAVSEPEPAVFFHGALHANECNGTGAVMHQIAALLAGYGHDPQVTARVDELELWFVPVLNPDGHRYVFDGNEHWADWRKTLRDNNDNGTVDFPHDGVDLNRNWDWRWADYPDADPSSQKYKGPYPWSEPEAVAARDFILAQRPVVVVDYHSPVTIAWSNYIFYPWVSQSGGQCPDYDIARDVADAWSDATETLGGGQYGSIYAYDTLPKEQCWAYGETGTLAFLMEIADQCWFTGGDVDTIAVRVARGSTTLVDRVLDGPGIRGTVTHGITGEPMLAEVRILELHDDDIGPRYTDVEHGQFHRLTLPGAHTVEVSWRDFVTQTVDATVGASGWAVVDVALMPVTTAVADVITDAPWLRIGDTLRGDRNVWLNLPAGMPTARVELFDPRGRRVAVLGDGLAAGRAQTLRLPAGLADGVYLVQARSGGQRQVARLVYLD